MKNDIAIKVHDLHKSFDLAENKSTSIKQLLINAGKKNEKHRQKVLDGLEFEIKKGEFFGIVGRNGSGKSTLLKLLAGVYTPDSGSIEVNGNLTPFIELGVGFNPELTGRDNVYLSASLLGFSRKQVDAFYDEVVDFSELHEHMDKKLKNYSSGMQVRLAFSIAVKAKNDILIFDEVLAVGDEAFQKKCMKIFEDYRHDKQTVILVTHSMESVRRLCTRALMLSNGKIELMGSVKEVADAYSQSNIEIDDSPPVINRDIKGSIGLRLSGCEDTYRTNDTMQFRVEWPKESGVKKFGISILGGSGEYLYGSNTGNAGVQNVGVSCSLRLSIGPGNYCLVIAVYDQKGKILEIVEKAWEFSVLDDNRSDVSGSVRLDCTYT